ncbi:(2,3-dihydroxybenzoyl)adenylate synthase [Burkholderia sp. FERM BP-3421]|jgi:2,3-dihydroxybenzoate-AMP ligase|uniref:(2,3-dihydroxybenzoyl)adenylate synthase n=1 Tax=Burkholderia sp. FERM BP-3421 TaxID=1494466 RepID=UPI0023614EA7|nr:(2,3-dihydroxybenzoyl)adenylate synthase [Burkholderia sp. FERM BP-3421]WDD94332.1 (2,3-dihydroxybenzoyl)adenylate synthase [Burkholderia sp. FERM BP-3421]
MTLALGTPWPTACADAYRRKGYWQGQSFDQWLAQQVERFGARTALVHGGTRWSYRRLADEAERLARGFVSLGIGPRDRVVVQLPNRVEFFAVVFALFRIGALPVFALPAHRRQEIGYFCRHAEAVAYVAADCHDGFDYRALATEVRAEAPTLAHVLIVGEAGEHRALDSLRDAHAPLPASPTAGEVAFLQLSGGSTGTPKLIPRTHDDYLYSVRESARICGLDERSVYLCVLPAAHNYALSSPGSFGVLHAGGTVVLCDGGSPEAAFGLIARERVTITALVPPLVPVWLSAAARGPAALTSLRLVQVGGARFDETLARRVDTMLGARLQQVFGMAEGLVNYTRLDDPREVVAQTQGRPISPDDEIRIVDDEDRPVAPGAIGNLLTRGPYTIRGYYRAEAHNARAFTSDGFYRTGDRVRMTEDGYLVVEGRAKDQINRGGEKVSAEEVEHLLIAHPGVVDAALVAMPDPYLGEKSCAYVIRADAALRAPTLLAFLREQGIAAYKIPDRIEFVDVFPKTAVGKTNKQVLRADIAARLAAFEHAAG